MTIPLPNIEGYKPPQIASIESQIANLRKASFATVHKVIPVDGINGAEAVQKELPAGASEIVAHRTENIVYLIAKDDNGNPLPIKPAKIEWIDAQEDPSGYVTRKDLEELKAELKAIILQKGEEQ